MGTRLRALVGPAIVLLAVLAPLGLVVAPAQALTALSRFQPMAPGGWVEWES